MTSLDEAIAARTDAYAAQILGYFHTELVERYDERSGPLWARDYSDPAAYERSVREMRARWEAVVAAPEVDARGDLLTRESWLDGPGSWWIEVTLDGGLTAAAGLVLPGRTPRGLVVFQHGLGSSPERVFGVGDSSGAYDGVGQRLVDRGYAVLAPMNLTGIARRNRAQQLARLAGTTIEGLELTRLRHLLSAVESRFSLDVGRIGFWGMSWGGLAAQMWAPLEERIAVAISSGFFNHRQNKMVVQDSRYKTFYDTGEEHAFLFGHLHAFGDADLASLVCPRPLLVQHGKADVIGWWPQVVDEFERAAEHWKLLGVGDRVALDLHEGGHVVDAEPGIEWIERWLPASS